MSKESKRHTNVVGVFPDEALRIRLVGAVLMEISDEWDVGRRYFSQESMDGLVDPQELLVPIQCLSDGCRFAEGQGPDPWRPWKHTARNHTTGQDADFPHPQNLSGESSRRSTSGCSPHTN